MIRPGAIACIGAGAEPQLLADKPGVTANVRLPGEEAREVPALDLSCR